MMGDIAVSPVMAVIKVQVHLNKLECRGKVNLFQ